MLDAEADIETVGEAANVRRAVFEARAHKPDVVADGRRDAGQERDRGHCPRVLQAAPDAKVLVLSMQDDPRYVREAFDAGRERLRAQGGGRHGGRRGRPRRSRAASGTCIPALGARLVAAEAEERKRAEADPLSEREREVLRLLALGHTNQEIAKMLYISVRTAETHRAHIMQKLRLSTRAELVRYALAQGLLEEDAAPDQ